MLPEPVLKKAAAEMLDYNGTGESVMENEPPFARIPGDHRRRRGAESAAS